MHQQVIVFLGAHPGDPIELAGGTLAKHVRHGDRVVAVVFTLGEIYARLPGQSVEKVIEESAEVFQKAMSILGVKETRWLDFGQPLFIDEKRFMKVVEVIREIKPDLVITHHFLDRATPDHVHMGDVVISACHWSGIPGLTTNSPAHRVDARNIYFGVNHLSQFPLFPQECLPDTYVDVTETADLVSKAYYEYSKRGAHITSISIEELEREFKATMAYHGKKVGVSHAEAFQRYNSPEVSPSALSGLRRAS